MTENEKVLDKLTCRCGKGIIKSKKQGGKYKVRCKSCRLHTDRYFTEEEAIKAWVDGKLKVVENVIPAT